MTTQESASRLAAAQEELDKSLHDAMPVGKAGTQTWPAVYEARETPPCLKAKIAARQLGLGDVRTTIAITDEDIRILDDKRKMMDQISFDEWFSTQFADYEKIGKEPVLAKWVNDVYPEYFTSRQQALEDLIGLQEKAALIGLRGIRSLEDLYFIYNLAKTPALQEKIKEQITMKPSLTTTDLKDTPGFLQSFQDTRKLAQAYASIDWTGTKEIEEMFTTYWKEKIHADSSGMEALAKTHMPAAILATSIPRVAWESKTTGHLVLPMAS